MTISTESRPVFFFEKQQQQQQQQQAMAIEQAVFFFQKQKEQQEGKEQQLTPALFFFNKQQKEDISREPFPPTKFFCHEVEQKLEPLQPSTFLRQESKKQEHIPESFSQPKFFFHNTTYEHLPVTKPLFFFDLGPDEVFVEFRLITDKPSTFQSRTIKVARSSSIDELKRRLDMDWCGIDAGQLRLVLEGQELSSLSSLKTDSIVHVLQRKQQK